LTGVHLAVEAGILPLLEGYDALALPVANW
jgi:hypothetical protein